MKTSITIPKRASSIFLLLACLIPHSSSAQVGIETTDPKSTFEINGSFAQKVTTVTGNTVLTIGHGIVICNNVSGAIDIELPTAVGISGRIYTIKRNTTSTANVIIKGTINGTTDLTLIAPGQTETIFSDGTEWKSLKNDTFGGPTGHTKFEADGTMVSNGAATTWDDIMVFPDATSKGNSLPTMTVFKNGVYLWMFADGASNEVHFTVQLPHSYKIGTDLHPHVHWTTKTGTPSNTTNGRVVWALEYTAISIGGKFPTAVTKTGNQIVTSPSFTIAGAEQHLITSLDSIDGTGLGISSILVCRLYRDGNSTLGTDDFPESAGLLGFDIHFEKDTQGSRGEYTK